MADARVTLPVLDEPGDCCAPPAAPPLDRADAQRLAEQLRALADPVRLQLLSLVMACDSACICDLTEPVGLSQPTVSHHMRILVEAGLLSREKRGRWAHYSTVPAAFAQLAELLADPRRSLRTPRQARPASAASGHEGRGGQAGARAR